MNKVIFIIIVTWVVMLLIILDVDLIINSNLFFWYKKQIRMAGLLVSTGWPLVFWEIISLISSFFLSFKSTRYFFNFQLQLILRLKTSVYLFDNIKKKSYFVLDFMKIVFYANKKYSFIKYFLFIKSKFFCLT